MVISSESNIRWLKEILDMREFVFILRHNLKIRKAKSFV